MTYYKENPNTGRNVVSVFEVQTYLNTADNSLTGFLQDLISYVSSKFEGYINQGIKLNTYIGLYDGDGTKKIYTAQAPIISISAIQSRTSPSVEFTDMYNGSATSNILYYSNYIELYDHNFPKGKQNIKISYTAGYSDCPGEIKDIALEAVTEIYSKSKKGEGRLGISNMSDAAQGGSYTIAYKDLWIQHKEILNNYKKVVL